jgi:hypothetical protein
VRSQPVSELTSVRNIKLNLGVSLHDRAGALPFLPPDDKNRGWHWRIGKHFSTTSLETRPGGRSATMPAAFQLFLRISRRYRLFRFSTVHPADTAARKAVLDAKLATAGKPSSK